MESSPGLRLSEFSRALTRQRLLAFRTIAITLFTGVTLFLAVLLFLYFSGMPEAESAREVVSNPILPILSLVHVVMAVSGCLVALLVNYFFVSPQVFFRSYHKMQVSLPPDEDTPEARYYVRLFTAYLIRTAILEGLTLFALITCLMGVTGGEIYQSPIYWLNLFSYGIFVIVFLWTFPTKSKLEAIFRSRFMPDDEILKA